MLCCFPCHSVTTWTLAYLACEQFAYTASIQLNPSGLRRLFASPLWRISAKDLVDCLHDGEGICSNAAVRWRHLDANRNLTFPNSAMVLGSFFFRFPIPSFSLSLSEDCNRYMGLVEIASRLRLCWGFEPCQYRLFPLLIFPSLPVAFERHGRILEGRAKR